MLAALEEARLVVHQVLQVLRLDYVSVSFWIVSQWSLSTCHWFSWPLTAPCWALWRGRQTLLRDSWLSIVALQSLRPRTPPPHACSCAGCWYFLPLRCSLRLGARAKGRCRSRRTSAHCHRYDQLWRSTSHGSTVCASELLSLFKKNERAIPLDACIM